MVNLSSLGCLLERCEVVLVLRESAERELFAKARLLGGHDRRSVKILRIVILLV